jgi:hypothetical protein
MLRAERADGQFRGDGTARALGQIGRGSHCHRATSGKVGACSLRSSPLYQRHSGDPTATPRTRLASAEARTGRRLGPDNAQVGMKPGSDHDHRCYQQR